MSKKNLQFSLLAFIIGLFVNAQIFPVQVNSNIVPPYLPSVSSYATSVNQKYFVNIFTADLSVVNRPATLKFYIEGNGIQAQSTPVVTGASPIYLNGGETISLTNIDLAPYFQIQNLQGISPAQYANNLPQGQYNYCIEVYDAFTNQKISQKSCTFYYFLYNEPPLLNLPINHDVQFFQDPQNLIFTWTPRHINATNIEYEFTLVELVDTNAPSNYAFAVGAPLYQTTTSNTILLYGPTEPQMIAGRKYAWRVKAVNQPGFGEDALFNNNGFSEIYDFVYAGNCVAPTFVVSFSLSSTQAKITWQPNPDHLGYKVEYRKLNTTNWFEAANFNNEAKLFDLEPSATYEFRVGAMCIGNQITYSPINQFTQPAGNVVTLNCGLMPTVDLSNQVLYTATMPSDQVFLAGDFPIHVTEVSGTTTYTGKGWTNLPYFSFVRIEVEFKDIKVNTGMALVDGVIKATYDPSWANIVNVNGIYDLIEDTGDAFSPDTDEHSYQVNFVIPNASSITVTDTSIVIEGSGGQTITIDRDLGESVIIRDANGNVYGVGPTANNAVLLQTGAGFVPSSNNTTGINSSGQVTAFDNTKAKVTFKRSTNGTNASKFADDERPLDTTISSKILSKYKKVNDYNYYYKGVENDGKATRSIEFIEARIETFDNIIVADSIVFNIKGSKANKIGNTIKNGNISTVTLEVPVFETVKELELLALIKKTTATGKNLVVGAAMIIPTKILPVVNVTIVPVNGATIPTNINASLQDIYKGVGVTFNTTVAPNYTSNITTLQCGDSGFMANYTAEQNTFIGKYTALHPADAKQYYVFVMNNITPSRAINGFMPLHRQIGFIFPSQTNQTAASEIKTGNDITTTIAHEIGHGIFELEHPWEEFSYPKTTPATNWLMDYAQGTKLPYMQWQKMSHPKFGLYIFQSDASGESEPYALNDKFLNLDKDLIDSNKGSFSFLSFHGEIISLNKKDLKKVVFYYGIKDYYGYGLVPQGVLQSFTIKTGTTEEKYEINISDGKYYNGSKIFNFPLIEDNVIDGVISFVPCGDSGKVYKFNKNSQSLVKYSNQIATGGYTLLENFPFVPFSASNPALIKNGVVLVDTFPMIDRGTTYTYDQTTSEMTTSHCEKPELFYILKIAQNRRSYPEAFDMFTDVNHWENPINITENNGPGQGGVTTVKSFTWANYLSANSVLRTDFLNNSNLQNYYKVMYQQFNVQIESNIALSDTFWDNLTEQTDVNTIYNNIKRESIVEIEKRPTDKKILALKKLINGYTTLGFLTEILENSAIKICGSFKQDELTSLRNLLVNEIGLSSLATKFDNFMGEDNFTKILSLVGGISETINPTKQQLINTIKDGTRIKIDDSIFFNKTSDATIDQTNIIFSKDTYVNYGGGVGGASTSIVNAPFLTVPYNQLVCVLFKSNFKFNNKTYVTGDTDWVPAIVAYAMINNSNTEQLQNTIWLTVDGVLFVTGIGEVKVLFSTANWLRKAYIVANLIGSGSNLILDAGLKDHLPENVVDNWRLVNTLLSVPEGLIALKEIKNVIVQEFRNAKVGLNATEKIAFEQKIVQLEEALNGAGNRVVRSIEQIAPNGIIPSNSQTNNLFHKWFDDLIPEELDLVLGNPSLKEALEARIRYPGGLHEWCMVCEIKTFKSWEISMSEIHRFRTKTLDLTGINPTTGATFVHGGAGSTAFHNELRTMIQSSTSLTDFNTKLAQLVNRWQIDPSLLPPLIK
jgi:Fibronectin type III domain